MPKTQPLPKISNGPPPPSPQAKLPNPVLRELLDELEIKTWSALLIGDGSGTKRDKPCGWASVLITRDQIRERTVYWGLSNRGTNNFAEFMAYLAPLNEYLNEKVRLKSGEPLKWRTIHIITDSQYCRDRGNSQDRDFQQNLLLWSALDSLKRFGVLIEWHWCRRADFWLNRFADHVSRSARLLAEAHSTLPHQTEKKLGYTVAQCNPLEWGHE